MVSLLKKTQWLSVRPLTPKLAEESLSSDENSTESVCSFIYSENSESASPMRTSEVHSSYLITQEDLVLSSTSQVSITRSAPNLRSSIHLYKIKSASMIQSFFRLKKLTSKFKKLAEVLQPLLKRMMKKKAFQTLKRWGDLCDFSANTLQRAWKKYKARKERGFSPRRKLLSRTVMIGTKLIKIQKFIENVVLTRNLSSPVSPEMSPLMAQKTPPRHSRSQSSCIALFKSLDDTQETNSATLNSIYERSRFGDLSPDISRFSLSLLMKKSFRVRTKKFRSLTVDQLSEQSELDSSQFSVVSTEKSEKKSTRIPQLFPNSKFFLSDDWESTKKKLECEYCELAKG